ncbi:hypothetical protein [Streptomyces purpureus]|uniref:hypothetical protein n=1 Tax=Streptomyces purpureus TaxID=1951 RepID=UPI000399F374|nr:hypothetical protein [Streptomyces purpureus]
MDDHQVEGEGDEEAPTVTPRASVSSPSGGRRAGARPWSRWWAAEVTAFPDTLLKLFRGENHGKLALAVAGE